MKKIKAFTTVIVMTIIFTFLNVQNINAAEKFEIDRLDVSIVVHEDGTYDVVEDYTVNYILPSLGIYRDIPTVYKMTFYDENGNRIPKTFRFPVFNIRVEGEEYSVDSQFNGEQIIIGPESGARYTGVREFSILYTVRTQPLNLEGQKEAFFQNLVSSWDTPVHEFHANIKFDKDVDLSLLTVKGKSISEEFPVTCTTGDNEFTCDVYETIHFGDGNGITAQLPLPDDYFVRANVGSKYSFAFMAAGILLIAAFVLKMLFGKRLPIIEKISFTAPEGYNSPMVGYIYKDSVKMDDIYSILFEWANKGVIRINETEDDGITFEKLKKLETANAFEETIFSTLFYKEGEITIQDWQEQNVYTGLLTMMSQVPKAVNKRGRIYDLQSQRLRTTIVTLIFITMSVFSFSIINFSLMGVFPSLILVAVLMVLQYIAYGIFETSYVKYIKQNKLALIGLYAVIYIAMASAFSYGVVLVGERFFALIINQVLFLFFLGLLNVALVIAAMIKVRTQHGSDLYGEVKGLYDFIKYAKKDELLMMQEENPHLYYDVLPYAQVFGMSDLWLKQFKEIEIPMSPYYTTYRTSTFNNYILMRSLTSSMRSMNTQVLPKVSSGTGGGSFSGGGFSGGGFSGGGGFGGGGGGSR